MIVIMAPGVEHALRLGRGGEHVRVEAFVAESAIEGLDEGVLHGFARPNELESDVVRIRPRVHRAADEFAAVVHRDRGRRAAAGDDRRQHGRDFDAGQRPTDDERQRFARVDVEDR